MNDDPRQWLAQVCREAREKSGANRTVIAAQLNQSEDVIRRFETLRGAWPPCTGHIVTAYAEVAGVSPISLWRAALDRWEQSASAAEPAAEIPAGLPVPASRSSARPKPATGRRQAGSKRDD